MNQINSLIEILKKYQGELTEHKIIKLTKIAEILQSIQQRNTTYSMIIPEASRISEILENEITEKTIYSIIREFFPENEIDNEIVQNEWNKEMNTNQILQYILQLVSTPEVSKYIGKKFMNKLTETAQYIFTQLIGCINENVQMEVEEMEKEKREQEEREKQMKQNEVKNIPIDESESNDVEEKKDTVNESFENRMKTISVDLDKIKRKFDSFKESCNEYGENIEYFMKKERPMKEVENLLRRGIEVNELNMRIMFELDNFVGLNEQNRAKRKEIIISIQNQLDENEQLMTKVKKTKTIVEQRIEILEKKKQMEEERLKKEEEEKKKNQMKSMSEENENESEEEDDDDESESLEENEEMKQKEIFKNKQKQRQTENNQRYVKPKDIKQEYEQPIEKINQKSFAERLREIINWNEMHFTPHFDVNEQGNTIIISSTIPGMKTDDFSVIITKNGDLKISGIKKPTDVELNMIIKTIHQRVRNVSETSMIEMVKRYCSGRYGSFSKIYELPDNIDLDNITMRYEEGVLRVNLPTKVVKRQPNRYVQNGFPFGNYQSFNPFGGFW